MHKVSLKNVVTVFGIAGNLVPRPYKVVFSGTAEGVERITCLLE